jgi:transcriptional regulator with XRE-family HTH domain
MPARIGPRHPVRVFLAAWREHLGMTQQQVGDRIGQGVTKGTVSRWESTKRVPTANVLAAYADALRIPVANLYRPPSSRPSLDDMIADAPEDLQRKAAEVVGIIIKTGT